MARRQDNRGNDGIPFEVPSVLSEATTPERRVASSVAGIAAGTIAVVFAMSQWAPQWAVATWVLAYLVLSGIFTTLVLRHDTPMIEQWWTISIGAMFGLLSLSVIPWSDDASHVWMVGVIVIGYAAFEMSTLPIIEVPQWWVGVVIACACLAITASVRTHPVLGLAFIGCAAAMISNADGVSRLKRNLEDELTVARDNAERDDLTGLMNRRGLSKTLHRLDGVAHHLVMIDINRFKFINDTHGYEAGDEVLRRVAAALEERFGDRWLLARAGGDEFLAVAGGQASLPAGLIDPIPFALQRQTGTRQLTVTLSAGVAQGDDDQPPSHTQREAGYALRVAKRRHGGLEHFTGDLRDRFDRDLAVARATHGGFDTESLDADAQVIVEDGRIVGCELLARWLHPDGTRRSPDAFMRVAAEQGMMPQIDDLMLEMGVAFAARFNNRPNAPFVSVNVTASHLVSDGLAERVAALLTTHRVRPERLMIEITESERLDDMQRWEPTAEALRDLGVKLAIDDFGSGYSSIERLHTLPISHLKFDRSLVQAVSGPFGEIVRGVARFGQSRQLEIIAEGVETLDEMVSLQALGITRYQGFHFGRPTSLDAVERHIISQLNEVPALRD